MWPKDLICTSMAALRSSSIQSKSLHILSSAMVWIISGLNLLIVRCLTSVQRTGSYDLLYDFGHTTQVWHWTIVLDVVCIKRCFL